MIVLLSAILLGIGSLVVSAVFVGMNFSMSDGLITFIVAILATLLINKMTMPGENNEGSWLQPFAFTATAMVLSALITVYVLFTCHAHSFSY